MEILKAQAAMGHTHFGRDASERSMYRDRPAFIPDLAESQRKRLTWDFGQPSAWVCPQAARDDGRSAQHVQMSPVL